MFDAGTKCFRSAPAPLPERFVRGAWRLMAIMAFVAGLSLTPAFAQDTQEEPEPYDPRRDEGLKLLTHDELLREVPGNTLSGSHDNGMPYSEFHSPDGRILGHNNFEPVRDGCWAIKEDSICYSYETGVAPGLFCWRFFRAGSGFRILLPRTGTRGSAFLENGNPRNHSDDGKPWSCQSVTSMR
jgi:hypothetical protein